MSSNFTYSEKSCDLCFSDWPVSLFLDGSYDVNTFLGAFMDTTTRNALAIIDEMVALRMQLAAIASQIESLKPAFFDACAALDTTPIKLNSAVISRKLIPF